MSDQPKHIERVAIIGASGHIGKAFAEALLATGKHTVTAISRPESNGDFPKGLKIVRVDYNDESSLVKALTGQQFLIITLSVRAPDGLHAQLVAAAAKAGIPYIMPNSYGSDLWSESTAKDVLYGAAAVERCRQVERAGAAFVNLACGFWYEWSLALGEFWFGISIKEKTVTFFDEGKTLINVSTWQQCGRAVAALLSLPESGASPAVADWKNKPLYIASFRINQRDMLDSLNRVLGTTDKDWTIKYEPSAERYKTGMEELQKGTMTGFAKALYARGFLPRGDGKYGEGEFESQRGLVNDLLGLPKEDLDECTRRTVEMVNSGWKPFPN